MQAWLSSLANSSVCGRDCPGKIGLELAAKPDDLDCYQAVASADFLRNQLYSYIINLFLKTRFYIRREIYEKLENVLCVNFR